MCIRLILALLLVAGTAGCAVLDKDASSWTEFYEADQEPGLELAASYYGNGDPVLLIHGFGASSFSWRHVIEPLAVNHQVIVLDLKGYGASPKPRDGDYSVYDQAHLVRNFILENNLENLTIIGHSYGGGVALATSYYLQHNNPGIQKRLVIIDGMAYPQKLPGFIRILTTPVLGFLTLYLVPNTFQVKSLLKTVYYNDNLITNEAVETYASQLSLNNAKYALHKSAKQIMPGDLEDFSARYSSLDMPTLLVWSREDEIISLSVAHRLNEVLPRSELVILEAVGHAPQEEMPQLLLPVLQSFLEESDD